MNLEPLKQCSQSVRENKYRVLSHIYMESRKMVLMNLVENGLVNTVWEAEDGTNLRK